MKKLRLNEREWKALKTLLGAQCTSKALAGILDKMSAVEWANADDECPPPPCPECGSGSTDCGH